MIFLRILFLLALAWALPVQLRARDDVVMTTTQNVGWAALFGAATTATATPTAAAATPAATTAASAATPASSGGLLSLLMSLFGGSGSSSSATTAAAATPAATTAATKASSTSGGSSGWLSSLMNLFGGSGASSSSTATATAAAAGTSGGSSTATSDSTDSPGFTGLVTVEGAGNGQSLGSSSSSSSNSASSGVALDLDISDVAAYAEQGAGISYSPYTKDGQCKSASQVALDMSLLSSYGLIRLYSVDCSGVENVLAAISSSQKLFLGVWDITALNTDLPSMKEQVETSSRGWSAVHSVSIGNEVVNAGTATASQVSSAVSSARSWFKLNAPDYSGYIVAVDTLAAMMADSSMCDTGDYIAVNCHPYFSGIEASTSGSWLKSQVSSLLSHCGNGKKILITESGWPTQGNTEGDAVPSVENQLLAIKGIANTMGSQVLMFTTFNDYWKSPGSWNVEQHWGIYGDPSA